MSNRLQMATIQAILSLRAQRWSYRRIARELGIHRETVARYVLAAESKPAKAPLGNGDVVDVSKPASEAPLGPPADVAAPIDPCPVGQDLVQLINGAERSASPPGRSACERGAAWLLGKRRVIGPHSERWAQAMLAERGIEGVRVLQGFLALTKKHPSALSKLGFRVHEPPVAPNPNSWV